MLGVMDAGIVCIYVVNIACTWPVFLADIVRSSSLWDECSFIASGYLPIYLCHNRTTAQASFKNNLRPGRP